MKTLKKIFAPSIVVLFLCAIPNVAGALTVLSSIPFWNLPTQDSHYAPTAHIVFSGTYRLHPNWVGNIYYIIDGAPVGHSTVSNLGGASVITASFTFDSGTAVQGNHTSAIKFVGGDACVGLGTCTETYFNFTRDFYSARNFIVETPVFPVISLDCGGSLDFGNVPAGEVRTLTCGVSNIGGAGTVLSGAVGPMQSGPFRCISQCSYSNILPDQSPVPVTIQFTAPNNNTSWDGLMTFSGTDCFNAPPLKLSAVSVVAPMVGQVSVYPDYLDFGTLASGATKDMQVQVTNIGTGPISGNAVFSNNDFGCVGSCAYTLGGGESVTRIIRFHPTGPGSFSGKSTWSGGNPVFVTQVGMSVVNPVLTVQVPDGEFVSAGNSAVVNLGQVSVGETRYANFRVWNVGTGNLSGSVLHLPHGYYTCQSGCSYASIQNGDGGRTVSVKFAPESADMSGSVTMIRFTNASVPSEFVDIQILADVTTGNSAIVGGDTYDFGQRKIMSNTAQVTPFQIKNTGTLSVDGTVPFLVGSYECLSGCGNFVLSPGELHEFSYRFLPVVVGVHEEHISLFTSAGTLGFILRGEGVTVGFQANPQYLHFGTVNIDEIGILHYVTMTNTGGIGTVNYTVSSPSHFACVSGCTGMLAPGESKQSWFQFAPTQHGPVEELATVNYHFGATDPTPRTITVQMIGIGNGLAVFTAIPPNWPDPVVSGSSDVRTAFVTNTGVLPFQVLSISITSGSAFSCIGGCDDVPITMNNLSGPSSGYWPIQVRFSPGITGNNAEHFATMNVYTNIRPEPYHIPLSAKSIEVPEMQVTPLVHAFGDVPIGSTHTRLVSVKNVGMGTLTYTSETLNGLDFSCIAGCSGSLTPSDSPAIVVVQYHSTIGGPVGDVLRVTPNIGGSVDVQLTGQGHVTSTAKIKWQGWGGDFGNVTVFHGRYKRIIGVIENIGEVGLGSGNLVVESASSAMTCVDHCTYTLPVGGTHTALFQFLPTTTGADSAIVKLSGLPGETLVLTGIGVPPHYRVLEK